MRFAFVARHSLTQAQKELAAAQGVELIEVGDLDAFTVDQTAVDALDDGPFEGVVVVHPAAALRLCERFLIGVFENANRAPIGERPQFEAVEFHVYDLRD